jgi:HEPN domain-containing protein
VEDKGRLEQARTLLETASNNFYAADSLFKQYADWQSYRPQIISHCVECIEWSAKALWFAFTGSYPKEHDLTEQRAKRHKSVVDSLAKIKEAWALEYPPIAQFARILLLNKHWATFHTPCKAGFEPFGVEPTEVFERGDVEQAMKDAQQCYYRASSILAQLERQSAPL